MSAAATDAHFETAAQSSDDSDSDYSKADSDSDSDLDLGLGAVVAGSHAHEYTFAETFAGSHTDLHVHLHDDLGQDGCSLWPADADSLIQMLMVRLALAHCVPLLPLECTAAALLLSLLTKTTLAELAVPVPWVDHVANQLCMHHPAL